MSNKFSPTLRLGDLNDFIAPSQACVVSLKGSKKPLDKKPDRPQVLNFNAFLSFIGLNLIASCSYKLNVFFVLFEGCAYS